LTQADLEKNARHVRGVLLPPDVNVIPWADPTRNLPPYWQPVELFWVLPSGRLHMERNLMRVARTSRDIADCRAQLLDEVRRLMEQGASIFAKDDPATARTIAAAASRYVSEWCYRWRRAGRLVRLQPFDMPDAWRPQR